MEELGYHGESSKTGERLAADLLDSVQEREKVTPPFILALKHEDMPAFRGVMEQVALLNMLGHLESLVVHQERRGHVFTAAEKTVIGKLSELNLAQSEAGRNLDDIRATFRWVSATD
jgi:hypothetical protein